MVSLAHLARTGLAALRRPTFSLCLSRTLRLFPSEPSPIIFFTNVPGVQPLKGLLIVSSGYYSLPGFQLQPVGDYIEDRPRSHTDR